MKKYLPSLPIVIIYGLIIIEAYILVTQAMTIFKLHP